MPSVIGVDLGGTNVRAASFSLNGEMLGSRFEQPSRAQEGTEAVIDSMAACISQAVQHANSEVKAVGIAVPGHIDTAKGVVVWAPNFGKEVNGTFQYWENVELGAALQERLQLPILLGNDANFAALGEYMYGSGKGTANALVMLTLGTGIGGGVILGQNSVVGNCSGPLMLVGGNQGGAELGHSTILAGGLDCNAGSYGALEAYCQRDSIINRATHRLKRGRSSVLLEWIKGDYSLVTPKLLCDAADAGDELALEIWQETGSYLGVAIGSYINVVSPSVFAIGGQIAKAGEYILGPARKTAENYAIPSLFRDCEIVQAELVEDAGMIGGAAMAIQSLTR